VLPVAGDRYVKVTYRETGGVGSVYQGCEVDTTDLTAAEAAEFEALVKASGVLKMGDVRLPQARDLRHVTLRIEDRGIDHSVTLDVPAAPDHVMPLLRFLRGRAKNLFDNIPKS
jgi:hypothetical protein